MVDPYNKLRHQMEHQKSKEYYRRYEDLLRDIANHGLTQEQIQQDEQPKNIIEWLNKSYK